MKILWNNGKNSIEEWELVIDKNTKMNEKQFENSKTFLENANNEKNSNKFARMSCQKIKNRIDYLIKKMFRRSFTNETIQRTECRRVNSIKK